MSNDLKIYLLKYSHNPKILLIERYIKFIEICKTINFSGYTEMHHIVPRSIGGTEGTNLIKLSARHHFIAHLLLAKATNNPKMIKALHKMIYSIHSGRNYKITNRVYSYIREKHSKIVSQYSKNTVVAKHLITEEVARIPKKLFEKYNGVLYAAIAKGRKDSIETKLKKTLAARKKRNVKKGSRIRSLAASKYAYETPKGYCEGSIDLLKLYPTFSKNTLIVINRNAIISKIFVLIHPEFTDFVGLTFEEYGIKTVKR